MTFGLVKHNNNSISAITTPGSLAQGKMTLLQTQTASSSASVSFTSNIDSTYPIYLFKFINIHTATNEVIFQFNMSVDGGSNYNVTKTSTFFSAYNYESLVANALGYRTADDLAQSTSDQRLVDFENLSNDNDHGLCGTLHLFDPSSTTFVKHFVSICSMTNDGDGYDYGSNTFISGYGNTTSAINAITFKMSSGNIDSGTIKLYGIKGS